MPNPRRREEMIAETTAKLLKAARRSFAKHGYHETSMDELCAEAGLTRGALYHHFGGKEGLLEAVVREIDAEINVEMEAAWNAEEDKLWALSVCCHTFLGMALKPEIQQIMLKDAPAVLGQRFREIDQGSALEPTTEALQELMDSGRIAKGNAEALARMLNGATMDAALWIASHKTPKKALRECEHALQTLLNGLVIEH